MNTPRYGWPVIIAASLHGALFLISSEPRVRFTDSPEKPPAIVLKPMPEDERIQMLPDDTDHDTGPAGGPVTALPTLPEAVEPLRGDEPFTVPVTPSVPSPVPVATLAGITGLPPGVENGVGDLGSVSLPDVHKLDRIPRAVVQTSPAYPDMLRREGINGSVTVEFVVGMDGRVVKADAVKWSHREFVDPAVRAVLRWRFEPGTQSGRKVSFRMAVPIEFNAAQ